MLGRIITIFYTTLNNFYENINMEEENKCIAEIILHF